MSYTLIDSGRGEKLEQFGSYTVIRPASHALWSPQHPEKWGGVDAHFKRGKEWSGVPSRWPIYYKGVTLELRPTPFGHLGFFPEHAEQWEWMASQLNRPSKVLNLFAYSGGATLYLAQRGHKICHLDASKGMVEWARDNATLCQLEGAPIRWIVEDIFKFLKRELKRGMTYDALIMDPPSFGRGSKGEVFKIEAHLLPLLLLAAELVGQNPSFVLLTTHTPQITPHTLSTLLSATFPTLTHESGEMVIPSKGVSLSSGAFARGKQ